MSVIISPRAEKDFKKLPKVDQIAIAKKIRSLSSLSPSAETKLSGYKDIFRIRIGSYRIVYRKSRPDIYLIFIGHRKDIYQRLQQLWR